MPAREPAWGYISHSTINVGDDVQALAARRFLPPDAVPVDREFISEFTHPSSVKVVVSGWFMHQAGGYWELPVPPPARSWPPAPSVDPFFISVHLTGTFQPAVFAPANIDYLMAHAPIGARDLYTLRALQAHGIPSYFSGCLTLTLTETAVDRNGAICLVDLDEACVNHVVSRARLPITRLSHGRPILPMLKPAHRLQYAEHALTPYRRARCVVTTRLHAALPCLAFRTPVLFVASTRKWAPIPRFEGLIEHLHHTSKEELLSGRVDYDFDDPPENPTSYLPLRENLIKAMTAWREKGA